MVRLYEHVPNAIGRMATQLWLTDYRVYVAEVESFDFFGFDDVLGLETETTLPANNDTRAITLEYLPDFLEDLRYKHYASDLRWHYEGYAMGSSLSKRVGTTSPSTASSS